MKNQNDIERTNRLNFRSCLEALSRPGHIQEIQPLFDSPLQAIASVMLYSEVSYCYHGNEDFHMLQAICGATINSATEADYLFVDHPDTALLRVAKVGTAESPELGATLIFRCEQLETDGTPVLLTGPGIQTARKKTLPVDREFIGQLNEKNDAFPMGVDVFFISNTGQLVGLPRTTRLQVTS